MVGSLKLVTSVADDLRTLSQFLEYYSKRGVEQFIFNVTDQAGDGRILEDVKKKLAPYNAIIANYYQGPHKWTNQMKMIRDSMERYCSKDDWVLIPDVDELHEYPIKLTNYLEQCDAGGINVITGEFCDRITSDGTLIELREDVPLFEQFPLSCKLSINIMSVPRLRTVALKGNVLPDKHFDTLNDAAIQAGIDDGRLKVTGCAPVSVHHFKWHNVVSQKIAKRYEHYLKLSKAGDRDFELTDESERLLHFLAANDGRIDLNHDRMDVVPIFQQKMLKSS